jgi:hypothetical protein
MDPDPDPGSGSCCFPSKCQQNLLFNTIFSAYYFLSYIYIIFQRSKVKKSHKIVGIKVFLTIFAVGAVTFMPDELDPGIGAGGEDEPVDRYEEEADHVAGQGNALEK